VPLFLRYHAGVFPTDSIIIYSSKTLLIFTSVMSYTKRQQDALNKASGAARASLRANFDRQNQQRSKQVAPPPGLGYEGTRRRSSQPRPAPVIPITQGAGAITKRSYGDRIGHTLKCWDAFNPEHLPLPIATASYTVVRTTVRFSSSARLLVFAPFRHNSTNATAPNEWTNIACVADANSALPINGTTNAQRVVFDMGGVGPQASLVPAAMSVQMVNPNPINATSGVVYAGVINTQAAFGGSADTWDTVAGHFIQRQCPRMLMAGKLAYRGVQMNSYPLNMSALQDFDEYDDLTSGPFTWSNIFQPTGLAPILVFNPNSIDLEFLATMEWRVRYSLANSASGGHTHHPAASPATWDTLLKSAVAMGNGVRDISEVVATAGQFADSVSAFARMSF